MNHLYVRTYTRYTAVWQLRVATWQTVIAHFPHAAKTLGFIGSPACRAPALALEQHVVLLHNEALERRKCFLEQLPAFRRNRRPEPSEGGRELTGSLGPGHWALRLSPRHASPASQ